MLQRRTIETREDRKRFIDFIYRVYRGHPSFKDTQLYAVRAFLIRSDSFTRECRIRTVSIEESGETACQAMLIDHPALDALQVSFFEALPDRPTAVQCLLEEARREARLRGLNRLIVGLNGHLSYGVGFLRTCHDAPISFDSRYSPDYYPAYFDGMGFRDMALSTYRFDLANVHFNPKLMDRIHKSLQFRTMDRHRFREEVLLFGRLCNACLRGTPLYFDRSPESFFQSLSLLRPLLRPENLLFAMKDNREIGFLFWHPDFNQVIPGGTRNSPLQVFLHTLFKHARITRFKLNVVGVLPAFRHTGAVIGLAAEACRHARGRFLEGETNFVWDSNLPSARLNLHMTDGIFRRYSVYERAVALHD